MINSRMPINKIKVIIVEDDYKQQDILESILRSNCPQLEIKGIAKNARETNLLLDTHFVDLIFLDASLDLYSSFDFLDNLAYRNCKIIFTSHNEKHASFLLKREAIDFVLKPFDENKIIDAVKKVEGYFYDNDVREKVESLTNSFLATKESQEKISIKSQDGVADIKTEAIVRIEGKGEKTHIHFLEGKNQTVAQPLKEVATILPWHFFRTNSTNMINLKHITQFKKENVKIIKMKNNHEVPMSQKKMPEFLDAIKFMTF